ncbi:MAG: branched-chain amino acid ABC transporter permease [Chloroflexota bacterium]
MTEFLATYGVLIVGMVLAAMLGLSLYLPLMAGQLSLASPGFYAVGGYIAAILSTKVFLANGKAIVPYPIPLILCEMAVAGVSAGLIAVVVGVLALRLRGIYLALATIAFVEILRVLSLNFEFTGGAVGIFNIPQPFGDAILYLWIAGPLLLLSAVFVFRLERVRVGRAFIAIREDELAADAIGINPTFYKVLAFTLGAILAGMVGALSAHFLNTWNARQGTFDASIAYLAFVLVGGSRTFIGPIAGGMALTALPEVLRAVAGIGGLPDWLTLFLREGRLIIYGALIVIGTNYFPQGLFSPALFTRKRKLAKPDATSP